MLARHVGFITGLGTLVAMRSSDWDYSQILVAMRGKGYLAAAGEPVAARFTDFERFLAVTQF